MKSFAALHFSQYKLIKNDKKGTYFSLVYYLINKLYQSQLKKIENTI